MLVVINSVFRNNKFTFLTNIFFILVSYPISTLAFQTTIDLQTIQGTTNLTTLDTNTLTSYTGPAYSAGITFRLFSPPGGKSINIQPGLNFFLFGGTSSESNSTNSIGDIKKNQYVGGGIDFRLSQFFFGGFTQTNNSTITRTNGTTNFTHNLYGARAGYEFAINPDGSTKLHIGASYSLGRSPITSIGSWYITSTTFFAGINFRIWKGSQ